MSEPRKVDLSFASSYSVNKDKVTIASLEDLEALSVKYADPLIITVGDDGRLSSVEVYDDYRE